MGRTEDPTRLLHDMTGWALERNLRFESLEAHRPSLEDVYLELTRGEEGQREVRASDQPREEARA